MIKRFYEAVALIVIFCLMPVYLFASQLPSFIVSGGEAKPGESFSVTISTADNPGIASFDLNVSYDSDKLDWIGIERGSWDGYWDTAVGKSITWFGNGSIDENTVIATLTFKVKEKALVGETVISVTYDEDNVYDYDEKNVAFQVIDGKVTIKDTAESHEHTESQEDAGSDKDTESYENSETNEGEASQSQEDANPQESEHQDSASQHKHNYKAIVIKKATCSEKGTMNYICECGESYTEKIPEKDHTPIIKPINMKGATKTEEGYSGDILCKECGKILKAGKKISAIGHE